MNISWIESWSKRKGFGADSEQKYEDSETKICLDEVRSLARRVLTLARPCHLRGSPFVAFAWILSYYILVFTERPAVSCGTF